jgi:fructokinase
MNSEAESILLGAIEAGGTKFVCAIGRAASSGLLDRAEFPTSDDPVRLMSDVTKWFTEKQKTYGLLSAIGVASFGPVDLDTRSRSYGFITNTPKPGWQNADLLGPLRRAFPEVSIGFDTDVNGAALGEHRWGAAQGIDDFVYITVGTGIGGGAMVQGNLMHGLTHPEMGHISMPQIQGDDFIGACPYHGRCWEGLCSGPAIAKRAGMPSDQIPADHPAWKYTAKYMSHALATIACVLSPKRIIVGGSVRKAGQLGEQVFFDSVRSGFLGALAGYIDSPLLKQSTISQFIVPPLLGDDAGVYGAMALAQSAMKIPPTNPDR